MRFAQGYIAAAIIMVGCATAAAVPARIDWRFVDDPEARRIELSFRNETGSAVCLTEDDWPNAAGKLDSMGGRVFLRVGDERFSIKEFNTGYCAKCGRRVAPGEAITGFLPYEDFDLPERLFFEPKVLEFEPRGVVCR